MRKQIFVRLVLVILITSLISALLLILLEHPVQFSGLFLRFFRILPFILLISALLAVPAWLVSDTMTKRIAARFRSLNPESASALESYPELQPVARQITDLKSQVAAQMDELIERKEQFQVLIENMHEGLLLISSAGDLISYNHAALELLAEDPKAAEICTVNDLTDQPVLHDIIHNALNGMHGETTLYIGEQACQLIANPVTSESQTTGAVLVLLDVTEREKRDALRREFTSNVSHELKTPLTSIYGIADMIESGIVKTEDIGGFAKRIRDESGRMIALIEDIIRLSRLDDDSFTEEILPIDLYEIAGGVQMQLQDSAKKRNITIELEGCPVQMNGVPVIVEEMLYNLCDNAVKYNVEGGSVRMLVEKRPQYAVFQVTDTGIGIPAADRDRIFERFYRVDKSHSRQIGGTGLGLSIVKHGAAFHNAKIELDSQLGKGTTITLLFPAPDDAAAKI